jgi:hypothetical protein
MEIIINKNMPYLGWAATISKTREILFIGEGVKVSDNYIFEGGCSFGQTPDNPSKMTEVFGTGYANLRGKQILFSASHSCDPVYLVITGNNQYASNSLPLAIALSGLNYPDARSIKGYDSLIKGKKNYTRVLYKDANCIIYRFIFSYVILKGNTVKEIPYRSKNKFRKFEDYKNYLIEAILSAHLDFAASGCAVYLSSGYDSPACAALAYQIPQMSGGLALCREKDRHDRDDSGVQIAQMLGMEVFILEESKRKTRIGRYPKSNRAYTIEIPEDDEVEHLSKFIGTPLYDESMYVPEHLLYRKTCLTGFHGGIIWSLKAKPNRYLKRGDPSGAGLTEYRIHAGFMHIPVPMISFSSHPELYKITKSKQMKAWSVGGKYDKPIARRICEEGASIPGDLFGIEKAAISIMFDNASHWHDLAFDYAVKKYQEKLTIIKSENEI